MSGKEQAVSSASGSPAVDLSKLTPCPFVIAVDSNESLPWTFRGLTDPRGRPYLIRLVTKPLWTLGLADYGIEGHEEHVAIERKSVEDCLNTIAQRRDKFEDELYRLHTRCDYAAVVVEGSLAMVKREAQKRIDQWGKGITPESVEGTVRAWRQRYPVCQWYFMGTRWEAEQKAFEILMRWWKDFTRGKLARQRKVD